MGGIQLALSKPCRSKSASHWVSLTYVLRPGTAFICCALTKITCRPSSNRLKTGRQNTPVLSIAITLMSWLLNQSSNASRSAVIVKNVRVDSWTLPSARVIMIVVTTVFLCTSNAAHRSWITCIGSLLSLLLLSLDDQPEVRKDRPLCCACSALPCGTMLLFWTPLDRLPPADSRYQLDSDPCLLITSSFSPIFILFSGSHTHRPSPDIRLIYTQ